MGKLIDETGNQYGKLTVLYRDPTPHAKPYWICKCECGEIVSVYGNHLRSGKTSQCKKCGYKQASQTRNGEIYKKLIGKHFNHITVIEEDLSKGHKAGEARYWKCKCDCGQLISLSTHQILSEKVFSCGCYRSKGEQIISKILDENNFIYEKEKTFDTCRFPDTNRLARFDFYLSEYNCLIEFDGRQHYEIPGGLFTEEEVQKIRIRDIYKNDWCNKNNIKLIRIPYYDENKISLEYLKEKGCF